MDSDESTSDTEERREWFNYLIFLLRKKTHNIWVNKSKISLISFYFIFRRQLHYRYKKHAFRFFLFYFPYLFTPKKKYIIDKSYTLAIKHNSVLFGHNITS